MSASRVLDQRSRFSQQFRTRVLSSAAAALGLATASAHASPVPYVGVQFVYSTDVHTVTLAPSAEAGVIPQDDFNAVSAATVSGQALGDANGNSTPITLTDSTYGNGTWNITPDTGPNATDNNEVLTYDSALSVNAGGSASFTLNNVPAGTYGLIAYVVSAGTGDGEGSYTVGGTTYYVFGQTYSAFVGSSDAWIQGTNTTSGTYPTANYVEFDNITVPEGGGSITLDDTVVTGHQSMSVNGLQLVTETPEPASLGILAVGSLGLLARRRRRA